MYKFFSIRPTPFILDHVPSALSGLRHAASGFTRPGPSAPSGSRISEARTEIPPLQPFNPSTSQPLILSPLIRPYRRRIRMNTPVEISPRKLHIRSHRHPQGRRLRLQPIIKYIGRPVRIEQRINAPHRVYEILIISPVASHQAIPEIDLRSGKILHIALRHRSIDYRIVNQCLHIRTHPGIRIILIAIAGIGMDKLQSPPP